MSVQPIADHAMLSDCHGALLLDRAGSIEWWCAPRFDSPSLFGRILDDDGGHFAITPRDVTGVERRYLDGSLVLESRFKTPVGQAVLTDALLVGEGERGHDLGKESPSVLARRLQCSKGHIDVDIGFSPRFEYGLTTPLLQVVDGGVRARGGPATLTLSTSVPMKVKDQTAFGQARLTEGEEITFAVEFSSSWVDAPHTWAEADIVTRIEDTTDAWRSWGEQHQTYDGPYAAEVTHSGRVLQGLTYAPTGAMVAAPTTSLPEEVGGIRNWDYRFCWVRDASYTLRALWVAACPDEAWTYVDYLTTAASTAHDSGELQIMFGIDGRRDLSERVLPWLSGWRESSPVRVGNGAWNQPQHDVYGEMLSVISKLRTQIGELTDVETGFLRSLTERAATVWTEPDHGIWEVRDEPRQYLHSKLMCWVALDSAIELADDLRATDRIADWRTSKNEIREAILEHGWSDEAGAFTQSFGSTALDASSLLIPIVGLLPFDDERVGATVEAIGRDLVDERGLVHRYLSHDGLKGEEGSFMLCTFWLAEALAGLGRISEAREVFERALSYCNDVGLLSEEVDTANGELIGNFPQAFSHVGLINAAWAIGVAEGTAPDGG